MDPDQYGQFILLGNRRRLDVQIEAVLRNQRILIVGICTDRLGRHSALDGRIKDTVPFLLRNGGLPAQFTHRRLGEWDGIESTDSPVEEAFDLSLLYLRFRNDFLYFTCMGSAIFQADLDISDQAIGGHGRTGHGIQLHLLGLFERQAVEFVHQPCVFDHLQVAAAFPAGQGLNAGNDAFDHLDFDRRRAIAPRVIISDVAGIDDERILLLRSRITAGQGTDQCRRDQHRRDERNEH